MATGADRVCIVSDNVPVRLSAHAQWNGFASHGRRGHRVFICALFVNDGYNFTFTLSHANENIDANEHTPSTFFNYGVYSLRTINSLRYVTLTVRAMLLVAC